MPRPRRANATVAAAPAANGATGLFFAKGLASAAAFQPPLCPDGEALDANRDKAVPPDVRASDPDPPRPRIAGEDELAQLEHRFLEDQRRLLAEGSAWEEDEEPVRPAETTAFGGLAPEADLRTLKLRVHAHDGVLLDGLFVQKRPPVDAAPAPQFEEHAIAIEAESLPVEPLELPDRTASPRQGRPRNRSRASLLPAQIAVLAFGFAALLVSAGSMLLLHPSRTTASAPAAQHGAIPPAEPPSDAGADFLARGEHSLKTGDITAARLYYERAANLGSALGAFMVGATFDPTFLVQLGVRGFEGDVKTASEWFRRARDLSAHDAPQPPASVPGK